MENNVITKLVIGFVVLIVGLGLIGSIATNTTLVTDKKGASEVLDIGPARIADNCNFSINESYPFTIAQVPTGWKTTDCPIANFIMLNQTSVAAVVTTDYTLFPANGTLLLKNTTKFVNADCTIVTSNTTTLTYDYCDDTYMNIAWGRTILNLVSGFFALALLGVSVGIFYSIGKDAGIIGK